MNKKKFPDNISVGVGCFHFSVKSPVATQTLGEWYVKELRTFLESISNVNNVIIEAEDSFIKEGFNNRKTFDVLGEGIELFPPSNADLYIQFDVFIPERIQNDLYPMAGFIPRTNTETFRVYIRSGYFHPVTFIEPLNPTQDDVEASDCVVVVREFLSKSTHSLTEQPIQFRHIGPSPFHANFHIKSGVTQNNKPFECVHLQGGYHEFEFTYNSNSFKDIREAREAIFDELVRELALFYRISYEEKAQLIKWSFIERLATRLIFLNEEKGILGAWKRTFTQPKLLQDAVIAIALLEKDRTWITHYLNVFYRGEREMGKEPITDKIIMSRLQNMPTFPTAEIRQVIQLFEERRSKRIETATTIIAAVIGGIIGSIITLFIK